jgi:protoporphyrinogen oxidase
VVAEVRNGEDIIDTKIARLRDAQPICDVGFAAKFARANVN